MSPTHAPAAASHTQAASSLQPSGPSKPSASTSTSKSKSTGTGSAPRLMPSADVKNRVKHPRSLTRQHSAAAAEDNPHTSMGACQANRKTLSAMATRIPAAGRPAASFTARPQQTAGTAAARTDQPELPAPIANILRTLSSIEDRIIAQQALAERLMDISSDDVPVPPALAAMLLDDTATEEEKPTDSPATLEEALPGLLAQVSALQDRLTRLQTLTDLLQPATGPASTESPQASPAHKPG